MKKALIAGAAAIAAGFLLLSKRSSAAQGPALPTTPRPPDEPAGTGTVTIPTVVIHGDPSSIAWGDDALTTAHDLQQHLNPNGSSAYGRWPIPAGIVAAFQHAYNADPTSKNASNVLGSASAPVYSLAEDDKFGPQTATALFYVTGESYQV